MKVKDVEIVNNGRFVVGDVLDVHGILMRVVKTMNDSTICLRPLGILDLALLYLKMAWSNIKSFKPY